MAPVNKLSLKNFHQKPQNSQLTKKSSCAMATGDVSLEPIQEETSQEDDACIRKTTHGSQCIMASDSTSVTATPIGSPSQFKTTPDIIQPNVRRKKVKHERNLFSFVCVALLSAFLLAHEARPTDIKMDRRSTVRSLSLSLASGLETIQSWRTATRARALENDGNDGNNDNQNQDNNENNNDKNDENNKNEDGNDNDEGNKDDVDDDVAADGDDAVADDAAAADDAVADDYYYEAVVEGETILPKCYNML